MELYNLWLFFLMTILILFSVVVGWIFYLKLYIDDMGVGKKSLMLFSCVILILVIPVGLEIELIRPK